MGAAGGAAKLEELSRAVFSALQQNRPENLDNFLPQAGDLRLLRRKSSADMKAVLDQNTPETIKQNLLRDFNEILLQTTALTLNLSEWELTGTKVSQLDKKNRQLYRVQLTVINKDASENQVYFEAFKIRNRYFLFRQMLFKANQ